MIRRTISAIVWTAFVVVAPLTGLGQVEEQPRSPKPTAKKVVKTDEEWARILTRSQYLVCRMKVTEPAFSGKLLNNHAKGSYDCVACGAELFNSRTKFNSGTGWPSFWRPVGPDTLATEVDNSTGESRIEVLCERCGAHLGHVFDDGPAPTGLRYCVNSIALKFVPERKSAVTSKSSKLKSRATPEPKSSDSTTESDAGTSSSQETSPTEPSAESETTAK